MVAIFKYSHLKNSRRIVWKVSSSAVWASDCSVKPVNLQVGRSVKSADELFTAVCILLSFYIFQREFLPSPENTPPEDLLTWGGEAGFTKQLPVWTHWLLYPPKANTSGKYWPSRKGMETHALFKTDSFTGVWKSQHEAFVCQIWRHISEIVGLQETLANFQRKISESSVEFRKKNDFCVVRPTWNSSVYSTSCKSYMEEVYTEDFSKPAQVFLFNPSVLMWPGPNCVRLWSKPHQVFVVVLNWRDTSHNLIPSWMPHGTLPESVGFYFACPSGEEPTESVW